MTFNWTYQAFVTPNWLEMLTNIWLYFSWYEVCSKLIVQGCYMYFECCYETFVYFILETIHLDKYVLMISTINLMLVLVVVHRNCNCVTMYLYQVRNDKISDGGKIFKQEVWWSEDNMKSGGRNITKLFEDRKIKKVVWYPPYGLKSTKQRLMLRRSMKICVMALRRNIQLETNKCKCLYWIEGPPKGVSGAMCYVQKSLACYVLCTFLFTLLCEIQIGCYAEVQPVLCAM